jgi:hypothetical protein
MFPADLLFLKKGKSKQTKKNIVHKNQYICLDLFGILLRSSGKSGSKSTVTKENSPVPVCLKEPDLPTCIGQGLLIFFQQTCLAFEGECQVRIFFIAICQLPQEY